MLSGIYRIQNIINNKIYIGSSIHINNREYKHFWMLNKGIHDNQYLQNSYTLDGKNSFVFEVVEYCLESELIEKVEPNDLNLIFFIEIKNNNHSFFD